MERELGAHNWQWTLDTDPDIAATELESVLLELMHTYIPYETIQIRSGTHPWFNNVCLEAVHRKQHAWGTAGQREESVRCSSTLYEQHIAYIGVIKVKLAQLKRGSRKWWKQSK